MSVGVGIAVAALSVTAAHAAEPASEDDLEALKSEIATQRALIADQEMRLRDQRRRLDWMEASVGEAWGGEASGGARLRTAAYQVYQPDPRRYGPEYDRPRDGVVLAQADEPEQAVGEAPEDESSWQQLPILPERTGVLTPEGTLVIEPSIEFTHSNVNRFVAGGVEIIDTVLIGVIEATEADRDTITGSVAARYGVTDRFEVELKVPYVYRDDQVTNTVIAADDSTTRDLSDSDIGDVELAYHYQLNNGTGGWPFLIGNFRIKSDTGTSPFDVERDNVTGQELELATGSGFWSFEPSVTAIIPSDPVVFYGNAGYLWNAERSIDEQISSTRFVGDVNPGNAVRISFGLGLALNEDASFSVGYQHDFIEGTETEISQDGGPFDTTKSDSLDIGSLSFGVNYQFSEDSSMNISVLAGVTEDAPDVRLLLRTPLSFALY